MSKSGKLNKFYQNNQLVTEISDDVQRSVFRGQGRFLGHLASGDERTPSVSAVDGENTVMAEPQANCLARFAYTPYGDRARLNKPDTPWAYHGERLDGLSGGYALGNGYRLYRPALMRFGAPDNMSPFGLGMLNAYAYCLGDPINHSDPSGHFALARLLRFAAPVMRGTTLVAGTALIVAGAVHDDKALYQAAAGIYAGGLALSGLLFGGARFLSRPQASTGRVGGASSTMARASVVSSQSLESGEPLAIGFDPMTREFVRVSDSRREFARLMLDDSERLSTSSNPVARYGRGSITWADLIANPPYPSPPSPLNISRPTWEGFVMDGPRWSDRSSSSQSDDMYMTLQSRGNTRIRQGR